MNCQKTSSAPWRVIQSDTAGLVLCTSRETDPVSYCEISRSGHVLFCTVVVVVVVAFGVTLPSAWLLATASTEASCNVIVTCDNKIILKLYFGLRQCPSEIILFCGVETRLILFQNYFRGLLQLMNICQHVANVAEIILK